MRRSLLLLLLFSSLLSNAATVKGRIHDKTSGEPLIGAMVMLKNTSFGASVGLDGSYVIKSVPTGDYILLVTMIGYSPMEQAISISENKDHFYDLKLSEDARQLSEVIIAADRESESEQSTRYSEQHADNVKNIIGAKAIQLLPDITVGNILQRVSGVSIVRNSSGDGQYAIIRGMDKRYNYTLVNGIKIPSPDNKNRYVPMDIFPGDLIERLEVVKALTPNMEGDAIGGAMNLILKSAPPSLTVSATAAGGYSNILNSDRPFSAFDASHAPTKSPAALNGGYTYEAKPSDFGVSQLQYTNKNYPINSLLNFSIGNRILGNKLGFIVGGSYQNIYRGTNSLFYVPDEPTASPYPNTYAFQELQIRQYSNLQKRFGMHAKFDYFINKRNKVSLYNFFMQLDELQHRTYHNPLGTGVATRDVHDRSKFTRQRIYNSTLHGDHTLDDKMKLDWSLAYSIATSNTPAWSDMTIRYRYDASSTLVSQELMPVTQRWTNNRDEDKYGYLNMTYSPRINFELAAGGMVRFKTRSNVYTEYELNTLLPDGSGNYQAYTSIDKAVFNFLPSSAAYANPHDPNNYSAKENIAAFYIQGKYTFFEKLQVLAGVRNENTYQAYNSELTVYADGKDGSTKYADLLPSVHVKYALSDKQNLRLTYYKAVSRPSYYEFVPVSIPGDLFTEVGNPMIRHTTADNYDLRYEFFEKGNDQVLAGVFYKQISNPIEYGFVRRTASNSDVMPMNLGNATNYGFELVVSKYIRNWGINANYTFTNSSITQDKGYKSIVKNSDSTTTIVNSTRSQTRPLQGQSNHIANVSLIYKNVKLGFDAQLSWVYTGRRINIVSPYKDLDYWQRGFSQVDFSAEKTIVKKVQVFLKITNLLDAPLITEVLSPNYLSADSPGQDKRDRIVVQKEIFHQTFLAGVRLKI